MEGFIFKEFLYETSRIKMFFLNESAVCCAGIITIAQRDAGGVLGTW